MHFYPSPDHFSWDNSFNPQVLAPYLNQQSFFLIFIIIKRGQHGENDMVDILSTAYPWIKGLHIISVISWMAALFYLPRLMVHHTEQVGLSGETHRSLL